MAVFTPKQLDQLHDVELSSPSSGQALVYNGSEWVNDDVGADLSEAVILAPASSSRNVIVPAAGGVIAVVLKAHASQSVDLQQWQKNDGTVLAKLDAAGVLALTPADDVSTRRGVLTAQGTLTEAGPANPAWLTGVNVLKALMYAEMTASPPADQGSRYFDSLNAIARLTGNKIVGGVNGQRSIAWFDGTKPHGALQTNIVAAGNYLAQTAAAATGDVLYLLGIAATATHTGSGSVTNVNAVYAETDVGNNSGQISAIAGVYVAVTSGATGAPKVPIVSGVHVDRTFFAPHTVGSLAGVRIANQGNSGTDNAYGLLIDAQSGGTESYAIYAAGGRVVLIGPLILGQTSAPADSQYANSQGGWWWDQANSVPKWKGKKSDGTVVTLTPQAQDADLDTIAALAPSNDDVLQRKSGAWANRTIAQLLTDLAVPGTTFQPLDSDLTAIAALSTTSYGRALLALADAAALRSTAGLVIGTDVEAHDADLTTIAGLSPSNDDVIQRKSGAWTNRTVSQLITDLRAAQSLPGYELDYVQSTSDTSTTQTVQANAVTLLTSASLSFDGSTTVMFEFSALAAITTSGVIFRLWEDSTDVTRILQINNGTAVLTGRYRRTPAAGTHQYTVRYYVSGNTGTTTATQYPTFLRITRV